MVVKKTVSTASNAKKSAASRKSASPVAVPTPSRAVTQTTKPKVVIQTKQLGEREAPMYAQASCCGTGHRKGCGKLVVFLLVLVNLFFTLWMFWMLRDQQALIEEQQAFQVLSNGGLENYQQMKAIYATPEYQQATSIGVYQLMERVNQTLASVQEATTEGNS